MLIPLKLGGFLFSADYHSKQKSRAASPPPWPSARKTARGRIGNCKRGFARCGRTMRTAASRASFRPGYAPLACSALVAAADLAWRRDHTEKPLRPLEAASTGRHGCAAQGAGRGNATSRATFSRSLPAALARSASKAAWAATRRTIPRLRDGKASNSHRSSRRGDRSSPSPDRRSRDCGTADAEFRSGGIGARLAALLDGDLHELAETGLVERGDR